MLAVTRRATGKSRVGEALIAAGLADRLPIVDRSPPAIRVRPGLYLAFAGTDREHAIALIEATLHKSRMPEPLRLAHLIGSALAGPVAAALRAPEGVRPLAGDRIRAWEKGSAAVGRLRGGPLLQNDRRHCFFLPVARRLKWWLSRSPLALE